jgi:hypothetical protein
MSQEGEGFQLASARSEVTERQRTREEAPHRLTEQLPAAQARLDEAAVYSSANSGGSSIEQTVRQR